MATESQHHDPVMPARGEEGDGPRLDALRGLIERLSAPGLTLPESKALRGRLAELLEHDGR
jgi:hypothetical protein